ncbi:hypothetical protein QE152_g13826 [Popillia japonica]|uniref:Uncharacterized protein n=1 Tax=Popillia japonica TaxID=7064 RepID=A0AAW1LBB2_POPJA
MNNENCFVGSGIDGPEKPNDRRRKTGEGEVANSPYYEEMLDVLGDTDKVNPVLMLDTISSTKKTNDEHETTTGDEQEISDDALEVNTLPNSEESATLIEMSKKKMTRDISR